MRIAKYIFLLLFLFTIAFIVFIATQPSDFTVKSEKTIAIPKSKLFLFVNDFKNWEYWYPSLKDKSDTKIAISETSFGEGASIKWKDNTISTSLLFGKDSIYQLEKNEEQEYTTHWTFKEVKEGTTVTWSIKGKMNFTEKMNAFLNGSTESYFISKIEEGLENINNYLVNEINSFNIMVNGIVTRPESYYIQQKDSCKISDFNLRSITLLKKINDFVKQNGIQANGDAFIQIENKNESEGFIKYAASIPIEEEILTTPLSDIKGKSMAAFDAVKITLKGDYSHKKEAIAKGLDYIKLNDYEVDKSIPYIEVFKINGGSTKIKPSEHLTEILIPLVNKYTKPVVVTPKPVVTVPKPVVVTKPAVIVKKDSVK